MIETREQWIEREARAARNRYWKDDDDDWHEKDDRVRQSWRNVVAPYYQDPVRDADTLRDLREIAINAYLAHPQAKDEGCMVDPMESAVAAVLRAAKPYVDAEWADIDGVWCGEGLKDQDMSWINSRIRYRFELPQPAPVGIPFDGDSVGWQELKARVDEFVGCDVPMMAISYLAGAIAADAPSPLRVPVDVDKLADAIRRAQGHFWNWKNISEDIQEGWRMSARAALTYLNIEPCAAPEYNPDDVALTPNNVNITSADPSRMVFFINGKHLVPQSALDEALAKVERQRNQLHAQCKTIESRGAELLTLRAECARLRQWQDDVQKAVKAGKEVQG